MNRFSFDPRRPQTDKFSTADKEDCFAVQLDTIASEKEHKEMCQRMYRTFRKRIFN